jgi:hypothetical protein
MISQEQAWVFCVISQKLVSKKRITMLLDPSKSEFFEIAKQADSLTSKPISITRTETKLDSVSLFSPHLGEQCPAIEIISSIGLENAVVTAVSTAEAEAIGGAGLFEYNPKDQTYAFKFPRFHLGPAAQLDMYIAISQLANTTVMKQTIEDSDESNTGIIQFTREGHLANWQVAAWLTAHKNIPTTLVKINHQPSDNEFTRTAHIDGTPNIEGFPKTLKRLYICDPIASGMQHVAMIEYLESIHRLPQEIVVVAPMSTLYGLQVIALSCAKRNISFKAGVLGSLLDSKTPLRYFSPYPQNTDHIANKALAEFMHQQIGDILHQWCIRCNWTASFMGGTKLPLAASEEELSDISLSNQQVEALQQKITYAHAESAGFKPYLLPFSSRIAKRQQS